MSEANNYAMKNFTLNERIDDFIFRRIGDISPQVIKNDEYIKDRKEYERIRKVLINIVKDEHLKLIDDFECISSSLSGIENEIIYTQGLRDGIKLFKILTEV